MEVEVSVVLEEVEKVVEAMEEEKEVEDSEL